MPDVAGFLTRTMENEHDITGYTVGYDQEDIQFPVYAMTLIAVALFAAALTKGILLLAVVGLLPAAVAYYNLPLIESGRPRLGSGEYGLFIEGLGLVSWRAVDAIEKVDTIVRGVPASELHVLLKRPLPEALLADWRQRPLARRLMRLPWFRTSATELCIPLDILDRPPDEIHATLLRMWRYHRGK